MSRTVPAPKTQKLAIGAADYFAAKLAYEATPWGLKHALEEAAQAPKLLVLDVRPADAFAQEHIRGAKNIPLPELVAKLGTLPKDKTIVTYCSNLTCALAPKAALELAQKGFQVQQLMGGLAMWKEFGFPVERN